MGQMVEDVQLTINGRATGFTITVAWAVWSRLPRMFSRKFKTVQRGCWLNEKGL